ncbi:MAG: metallophosphoesterase family protein [Petrotogales bacterium]
MKKQQSFIIPILVVLLCSSNIVLSSAIPDNDSGNKVDIFSLSEKPSEIRNVATDSSLSVVYPLSSVPVIVEIGGGFTLRFEADEFDAVYAYISTAYEPVVNEFWLTIGDVWFNDDAWNVNVSIPPIVPPELYNVSVLLDQGGLLISSSRPRAVSVIEEFSDDFSFIHITDFHVGDPRGFTESIWRTLRWKSIKRCIHEINLLHPDFVIISGDLVFGQLYWREYSREYPMCYEMLQMFDVPTYICPGNHDGYRRPLEDGLEFWTRYFGPHYYSFDYGDFHFLAVNSYDWSPISRLSFFFIVLNWGGSIREKQLQWIEDDLASHNPELTFMFMHHNPLWDTKTDSLLRLGYQNREQLLSLIDQYGVDMVLAGHVHYDNVSIANDTLFITTTTPGSGINVEDGYWGYRLVNIEDGEIASYNYKEPKYSIPSYKLKATYQRQHKAKVENELEIDVIAHLKFVLPKADYKVDYGEIVLQREDEKAVELYIQAMVEQESNVIITVSRELNSNN